MNRLDFNRLLVVSILLCWLFPVAEHRSKLTRTESRLVLLVLGGLSLMVGLHFPETDHLGEGPKPNRGGQFSPLGLLLGTMR